MHHIIIEVSHCDYLTYQVTNETFKLCVGKNYTITANEISGERILSGTITKIYLDSEKNEIIELNHDSRNQSVYASSVRHAKQWESFQN